MIEILISLGNDLSRTFGWGPGFKGDERLAPLLQMTIQAPVTSLGTTREMMKKDKYVISNSKRTKKKKKNYRSMVFKF